MMEKAPTILLWSIHKGKGWETHYEQMQRWYLRFNRAESKTDIFDFIFIFFQSCYHLRDWLPLTSNLTKNDQAIVMAIFFTSGEVLT